MTEQAREKAIEKVEKLLRTGQLTTADRLAASAEVSARTVYRMVSRLRSQGLRVRGEAGVGYLVRG